MKTDSTKTGRDYLDELDFWAVLPITIIEMQRLNIACKRILGSEEWERRVEVAWESLRDLEVVTADMLESAILDGFGAAGIHFDHKEAQKLSELADYCVRGYEVAEKVKPKK